MINFIQTVSIGFFTICAITAAFTLLGKMPLLIILIPLGLAILYIFGALVLIPLGLAILYIFGALVRAIYQEYKRGR